MCEVPRAEQRLPTPPEVLIGADAIRTLYLDGWDVIRMSRRAELEARVKEAELEAAAADRLAGVVKEVAYDGKWGSLPLTAKQKLRAALAEFEEVGDGSEG